MERAVTPRTRLVMLCSPHNPVGRVWTRGELDQLAAFCVRHDLLLVSDEIHCDLLLEPENAPHTTALKLEGEVRSRTITLMAASKTYNIPGLGLSFAIIPDESLRRRFALMKNSFVAEISPLSFMPRRRHSERGRPGGVRCAVTCAGIATASSRLWPDTRRG